MKSMHTLFAATMLLAASAPGFADCAAEASVRDVTEAFAKGQKAEKAGDTRTAFEHFVVAQEYTCEVNPVAGSAAARAAALSKPLAETATAKGDREAAFDLLERGGHFQAADQALLAWADANPDDANLYLKSVQHFEYRTSPAFSENEVARLKVTGKYTVDNGLVERVRGMPKRGVDRALDAETAAFDEQHLRQRLALVQSRPENLLDEEARKQYTSSAQALQARHPGDALSESRTALDRVRQWSQAAGNAGERRAFDKRLMERANLRITALTGPYAGAPDLLAGASDYLTFLALDDRARAGREAAIRIQAERLGDTAMARDKLLLASDYFAVARADDKARIAQERFNARQQQQMRPAIDAARRDAQELAASFGDAAQIEAMQKQAREMQRKIQESKATGRKPAEQKSRDELAKELGM